MRAIWEGSISFGLINIPVRLYNATRERRLAFHYLHKDDLCPIKYVKVCKTTGEEIPYTEIVKGYEYKKGDFVILDDEDFRKANVEKTQSIDVFQFADAKEIDMKLWEKPYYLEPTKQSSRAYALLRDALKKSKKVGIAKFVLRTREKLGVLKPEENMIMLDQIRFADEIITPEDILIPEKEQVGKRELEIAIKLIEQLTDSFKFETYHDTYTEELQRVINEKAQGKIPKAKGKVLTPITEMEDIMEKLKESLEHAQKK